MNFLHAVVISIAIYDGVSTLFTEDLLLPCIAFPFFMNRTQFGLCIPNLSREEKGD